MRFKSKLTWEFVGLIAMAVVALAFICLAIWGIVEYGWPAKASWREVCDAGYTQYYPATTSTCSNGTCTTSVEMRSHYVCTKSHWTCRKGRDGSTRCEKPRPGSDY